MLNAQRVSQDMQIVFNPQNQPLIAAIGGGERREAVSKRHLTVVSICEQKEKEVRNY